MRKTITVLMLIMVVFAIGDSADLKKKKSSSFDSHNFTLDNVDIDIHDGTLVMVYEEYDDAKIEITRDFELYIDNEKIKLDNHQQKLVENYYLTMMKIIDDAKYIGLRGAEVGVEGAKIGLKAVAGVFKLLSDDYDSEDLEREMEAETEELEIEAEKLEELGEELEEEAEKLERLHDQMIQDIPELRKFDD